MLTLDELKALTGYRRGSAQARWVRENLGLEPMIGLDGHPRLTWFIVEHAALQRRVGAALAPVGVSSPSSFPKWRNAS